MTWTQDDIDDQMLDHTGEECWDCAGEGFYDECECESVVDICCCATPTPRRCRTCSGTGTLDTE